MASVIFWMFFTESIRSRSSRRPQRIRGGARRNVGEMEAPTVAVKMDIERFWVNFLPVEFWRGFGLDGFLGVSANSDRVGCFDVVLIENFVVFLNRR